MLTFVNYVWHVLVQRRVLEGKCKLVQKENLLEIVDRRFELHKFIFLRYRDRVIDMSQILDQLFGGVLAQS